MQVFVQQETNQYNKKLKITIKSVDIGTIDTHNTRIHHRSLSGLVQALK
jgi:hypothetical protein